MAKQKKTCDRVYRYKVFILLIKNKERIKEIIITQVIKVSHYKYCRI